VQGYVLGVGSPGRLRCIVMSVCVCVWGGVTRAVPYLLMLSICSRYIVRSTGVLLRLAAWLAALERYSELLGGQA